MAQNAGESEPEELSWSSQNNFQNFKAILAPSFCLALYCLVGVELFDFFITQPSVCFQVRQIVRFGALLHQVKSRKNRMEEYQGTLITGSIAS